MPESNSRKRLTVIASPEGIKKAEKALIRLGFESKANFAKAQLISRNAVTNFFQRHSIQADTFKRICSGLQLNWEEILETKATDEMVEIQRAGQPEALKLGSSTTIQEEKTMATVLRQVTVVDQHNETKAVIVLEGDIASVDANFRTTIEAVLKIYVGATIRVQDIEGGSIRIKISGSPEDIERLIENVTSGEITELSGLPIQEVERLDEQSSEAINTKTSWNKWNVVQEIINSPAQNRELSNVDLSDTDLSGANLSGANLSGANLSGANLSGAHLSGANLSGAYIDEQTQINAKWRLAWEIVNQGASQANLSGVDLSGANLGGANLSGANLGGANLSGVDLSGVDLSGANLSGANLIGANLSGANLSGAYINEETQINAKWRLAWEIVNQGASQANLSGVDLSGANLSGVDLSGANLSGVDLSGVDLSGANLSGANLSGANLSGAYIDEQTQINAKWRLAWEIVNQGASQANLSGVDLSGANL
nr:pentapeptide repeat-containing protein [Trichocoleus desertorum ATA4-8-CV12]